MDRQFGGLEVAGIILIGGSLLLSGCANLNSIYREAYLSRNEPSIIIVDAKQRAILTSPRPAAVSDSSGKLQFVESYRAFCAEPSPDVFSVLSQAASASGQFGRDTTSINAALQAAFSNSEAGSTIPRTQTINMLREMMYRTCERYMSGALSKLEFPIQAVRDQRIMVSILAIEQLTGAVTPRPVALLASSNASSGQDMSAAIVRIDDAWQALQAADTKQKQAQSQFDQLEGADPKCSAIKAKLDKNEPLSEDETKKKDLCSTAQAKLTGAQADRKAASDHYDALKSALGSGGNPLSAGSAGQLFSGATAPGIDQAASISAVSGSVERIVQATFAEDEYQLFCLRAMDPSSATDEKIKTACASYLASSVQLNSARLDQQRAEMQSETQALLSVSGSNFDLFWSKVAAQNANTVDSSRLSSLIDTYLKAQRQPLSTKLVRRLSTMKGKSQKGDIKAIFETLPLWLQTELAK